MKAESEPYLSVYVHLDSSPFECLSHLNPLCGLNANKSSEMEAEGDVYFREDVK